MRDLERSLAFYRDLLGMELLFEQEKEDGYLAEVVGYEGAHVRMAHLAYPGGGHRIELFQYLEPEPRGEAGEPRDVGITHICVAVDDLAALHERLRGEDVDFYSAPVLVDTGANAGASSVYLRDPDGITLELFQAAR